MGKVTRDEMTVQEARQALSDAEDALGTAIGAAEKARVDVEMANDDLIQALAREGAGEDGDGDEAALAKASFDGRLERFLREQPDVADVTEVGGGIYGFRLAGLGDVSLSVNPTGTLDW